MGTHDPHGKQLGNYSFLQPWDFRHPSRVPFLERSRLGDIEVLTVYVLRLERHGDDELD